jgi:hypothetical protein
MNNFVIEGIKEITYWKPVPEIKEPMSFFEYMRNNPCSGSIKTYIEYKKRIQKENEKCIDFWNNEGKHMFNEDKTMYLVGKLTTLEE